VGCEKELILSCKYYLRNSIRLFFILISILLVLVPCVFICFLCFLLCLYSVCISTHSELCASIFCVFSCLAKCFDSDPVIPLFFLVQSMLSIINMQFDLKKISVRCPWSRMKSTSNLYLFFGVCPSSNLSVPHSVSEIFIGNGYHMPTIPMIIIVSVECGTSCVCWS
jgi:hypothetical protein